MLCFPLISVVCSAMAVTTNSPGASKIAEIFKSMEYGPVSDASSFAKVCDLFTYMHVNGCFKYLLHG
jgi:hypothetical protein